MNPAELRKQAAAKLAAADSIENAAKEMGREASADELKKIDALTDESLELVGKAEAMEAEEAKSNQRRQQRTDLRAKFAGAPANPLTAQGQIIGREAKREFSSLGEFMFAACLNPTDQRLNYVDFDTQRGAATDQSFGVGSRGGFAVPEQFRDTMLSVSPQEAIIRPRATVIPAGTPPDAAITMPALEQGDDIYGGVSVSWIQEGATKPQTDAEFRQVKLEPKEIAGHIAVTDTLLRNWGASEAFLSTQLRRALTAGEDQAFLNGNGIGKPKGIYNSGAIVTVARDTADEIAYEDVVNMFARLKMGGPAFWLTSQTTLPQLMQMKDGDGRLIWQPNAAVGMPGTIFGLPIVMNERNPVLGDVGDLALLDANYYLIKDGSGPFVEAGKINDDFVKNKTRIKIFRLVDGDSWIKDPIPQENGNTVSPFILLGDPVET